jgi:RimJ/RimL family protein N-acetyltransferase
MQDPVRPTPNQSPIPYLIQQTQALQAATASDPLSLSDEFSMQQSWRLDPDKLTFIICRAPTTMSASATSVDTGVAEDMIGDVNLFLYPDPDFESTVSSPETGGEHAGAVPIIGELEIMLAERSARRKGFAYNALRAFMAYITDAERLPRILEEYRLGSDERSERYLRYLRVKVDKENSASLGLFGKVGFERVGEVNYFGEVEMRLGGEGLVLGGEKEGGKVVEYKR